MSRDTSNLFFVVIGTVNTAYATIHKYKEENATEKLQKKLTEKSGSLWKGLQIFTWKKYWSEEDNDYIHFELQVMIIQLQQK